MMAKENVFEKIGKRPVLDVRLKGNPTAKDISGILERAFRLSGCTQCGLNGFDIHFHGRPEFLDSFDEFDAVDSVGLLTGELDSLSERIDRP